MNQLPTARLKKLFVEIKRYSPFPTTQTLTLDTDKLFNVIESENGYFYETEEEVIETEIETVFNDNQICTKIRGILPRFQFNQITMKPITAFYREEYILEKNGVKASGMNPVFDTHKMSARIAGVEVEIEQKNGNIVSYQSSMRTTDAYSDDILNRNYFLISFAIVDKEGWRQEIYSRIRTHLVYKNNNVDILSKRITRNTHLDDKDVSIKCSFVLPELHADNVVHSAYIEYVRVTKLKSDRILMNHGYSVDDYRVRIHQNNTWYEIRDGVFVEDVRMGKLKQRSWLSVNFRG